MYDRSQNTIFDVIRAEEEAQAGIGRAADNKPGLLDLARRVACEIGSRQRFVTMDDVTRVLVEQHRLSEFALGNAAGSVFRGPNWHWDGVTQVKSTRVASHGRYLKVWEFVGI